MMKSVAVSTFIVTLQTVTGLMLTRFFRLSSRYVFFVIDIFFLQRLIQIQIVFVGEKLSLQVVQDRLPSSGLLRPWKSLLVINLCLFIYCICNKNDQMN